MRQRGATAARCGASGMMSATCAVNDSDDNDAVCAVIARMGLAEA